MPFWFWNDDLDEDEIVRQIRDFDDHGVYGFLIHPRVGLPRRLGWMSEELLQFYDVAVEEARRRDMYVILYDEGMYPSGSSAGQVVAANPEYACRCLAKIDLADGESPELAPDENLVSIVMRRDGGRLAVVDRQAVGASIRGIHYIDEGNAKDDGDERCAAADNLNPASVAQFIECGYDRFAERYGEYFGNTIAAIFTDEPGLLARVNRDELAPGTTGILSEVNRLLGYDLTEHLPALWYDDEPDALHYRDEYMRGIKLRMNETYYAQLHAWCERHGLDLTGHPAYPDEIGPLRFFHVPGQDTVWRGVIPDDPKALEGRESTQAKCTSSAMIHLGRRRNGNECCGAYGHNLTWEEMVWLAHWCFVRGVSWLFPHAFYYSLRGPRIDERPPDVGHNAAWWDRYPRYADACRRLSWLNTDCRHVCDVGILGKPHRLGWQAAKVCFENQVDFNYIEERHLWEDAVVDGEGIHLAGMHYRVLIVEDEPNPQAGAAIATLEAANRLVRYDESEPDSALVRRVAPLVRPAIHLAQPCAGLRVRHVIKEGLQWFLLFDEVEVPAEVTIELALDDGQSDPMVVDPWSCEVSGFPRDGGLSFAGHEVKLIAVEVNE